MVIGLGLSLFGPSASPVFEAEDPVILMASPEDTKSLVAWIKLVAVEVLK